MNGPTTSPSSPPRPDAEALLWRARLHVQLFWSGVALLLVMSVCLLGGLVLGTAPAVLGRPLADAETLHRLVLAMLAGGAVIVAAPFVVRPSRIYVAQLVERQHPQLKNALISFVQMSGGRGGPEAAERCELLELRLRRLIPRLDPRPVVDWAAYWWIWAVLGALFALFVLAALFMGGAFVENLTGQSAAGLARPEAGAPAFSVGPGNATVPEGVPVTVTVRWRQGRAPEAIDIFHQAEDGLRNTAAMTRAAADRWTCSLPPVRRKTVYQVEAGAAQSPQYTLTTVEPPRVLEVSLDLEFPEYTRLEKRTLRGGDVEAPAGTRVVLRATLSRPVREAALAFDRGEPVGAQTGDGAQIAARWTVQRDDGYTIRLRDAEGFENRDPEHYEVRVQPDRPPALRILEPKQDTAHDALFPIAMSFVASDDFGLSKLVLRWQVEGPGGASGSVPVPFERTPDAQPFEIQPAQLGWKNGMNVTLWLDGADAHVPQAQTAQSERRFIRLQPLDAPFTSNKRIQSKRPPSGGGSPPKDSGGKPKQDPQGKPDFQHLKSDSGDKEKPNEPEKSPPGKQDQPEPPKDPYTAPPSGQGDQKPPEPPKPKQPDAGQNSGTDDPAKKNPKPPKEQEREGPESDVPPPGKQPGPKEGDKSHDESVPDAPADEDFVKRVGLTPEELSRLKRDRVLLLDKNTGTDSGLGRAEKELEPQAPSAPKVEKDKDKPGIDRREALERVAPPYRKAVDDYFEWMNRKE